VTSRQKPNTKATLSSELEEIARTIPPGSFLSTTNDNWRNTMSSDFYTDLMQEEQDQKDLRASMRETEPELKGEALVESFAYYEELSFLGPL